eukprot:INCI4108.3.p2 GENE.INCI4108.3~~INCI4108.3.p2  ORF type:complete len:588 (-),score=111.95 INCI4108.3:2654-4345(-)
MNNMEKSAVAICTYEAYGGEVLDIFSRSSVTVVCAADTNETDVTLKALHQFNLGRDKILRQLADGSAKLAKWVQSCPGPFLAEWLRHHGSNLWRLGKLDGGSAEGAEVAPRKRKIADVGAGGSGAGAGGGGGGEAGSSSSSSGGGGDSSASGVAVAAFNRFHDVDPKEDAFCKDLYKKRLPELRHVLQDRVMKFLEFLKEYHGFFSQSQGGKPPMKTAVTEMFVEVINYLRSARHEIMQYFYRDKKVTIELKHYQAIVSSHSEEQVKAALVDMLRAKQILFPLKRYLKDYERFGSMFENLQRLSEGGKFRDYFASASFVVPGVDFGRPVSNEPPLFPFTFGADPKTASFLQFRARSSMDDYWQMDMLTDFFTEDLRMKARREDTPLSVWDAFHNDVNFQRALVNATLRRNQKNFNGFTPHAAREAVFEVMKECTQFKASLTVCIFRRFKATRVLDISAGWGDRLLGALASGVERYVATDPNVALRSGHNKLISKLAPLSRYKPNPRISILYEPFETATLPAGETYDLVFTSPPFFDFEIYTNLPGQSVDGANSKVRSAARFAM